MMRLLVERHAVNGLAKLGNRKRRADEFNRIASALLEFLHLPLQLEFSSARSAIRIRRSALNGFSMKSNAPRLMALTAVSMLP